MLFDDLETRKEIFLSNLRGKKQKYKRYLGAPIRYPGGKSLAVGYILELLPNGIERVISPFLGGGSVEVAISKELDIPVIGFDVFDILVNFWQVLLDRDSKRKMLEILHSLEPNRETYNRVKEILKRHWEWSEYGKGSPKYLIKDRIVLASYYYFNYNLSYGPGFLGWSSNIYLNKSKYLSMLEKLEKFQNSNLEVYQSDFRAVLEKYRDDFLYLDPPYYIGSDSKMFKGIYPMRNFPIHHNGFPHEILRDKLKEHRGGFILSYNDSPTIREFYKEYHQYFPSWQYTMGQGEKRIGKYRKERNSNIKQSHEIVIFSPPN